MIEIGRILFIAVWLLSCFALMFVVWAWCKYKSAKQSRKMTDDAFIRARHERDIDVALR